MASENRPERPFEGTSDEKPRFTHRPLLVPIEPEAEPLAATTGGDGSLGESVLNDVAEADQALQEGGVLKAENSSTERDSDQTSAGWLGASESPPANAASDHSPDLGDVVDSEASDDVDGRAEALVAMVSLGAADVPEVVQNSAGSDVSTEAGIPEDAFEQESGARAAEESASPAEEEAAQEADVHDSTASFVNDAFDQQATFEAEPFAGHIETEGDLNVHPLTPADFERDELLRVLRLMLVARRLDEKMLTLLKQGKGFFHIGSSGHEATQIALGNAFTGGHDWFALYYRDMAMSLAIGMEPVDILRAHFGKASDPNSGGRQLPEHFSSRELNILVSSSSVAAQYLPAVGCAIALQRDMRKAGLDAPGKAVYVSGGEGSTSQGAFHEALNWAAREALPIVFHVEDNKFAISVPVAEQTAGGSIWPILGGYPGLARCRYDGTDFFASTAVARAAYEHASSGRGPVALHADVVRLLPHSSSDDHSKYRDVQCVDADRVRDPLAMFSARILEAGVVTEDEVEALRLEVHQLVDQLARSVEAEADPTPESAATFNYYEGPDEREYEVDGPTGELIVMVDAINHALDEELTRDERVVVYGEDVGGGKGGVFTATRGLTAKHGADRCFNSPLAEHSIIGSAVGLAAAGYMPVVEIQFADYIWPGLQPLRNQVASFRYRSNNEWACPMVLRIPAGGYIHGGLCHSQNIEAFFGHFPGLQVVMPSNAADAKGMLKTAIRGYDPVLFLEHKSLYRQGPARSPEPHADYLVPFGKASVVREGADLTIVTWGAIVYKALNVARALEREGVSVEVIDIRSILPLDIETILTSARKTGRVLVAHEDHLFMGFGAEIAAQISEAAFGSLDAPVRRLGGAFTSIPYADVLEKTVLPQDDDVLTAARAVLDY